MGAAPSSTTIPPSDSDQNPDQSSRFDLPGLNLPLNWLPNRPGRKWTEIGFVEEPSIEGRYAFPSLLDDTEIEESLVSYVSHEMDPIALKLITKCQLS